MSFWVICEFVISCHCLVEMSDLTVDNLQMENKLTFWKDFILIRADTSLPNIPFHNCHCFQQQKNALSVSFVSDSCRLPVFCSVCNYWNSQRQKCWNCEDSFSFSSSFSATQVPLQKLQIRHFCKCISFCWLRTDHVCFYISLLNWSYRWFPPL